MIILVSMSSMKFLQKTKQKNRGKQKEMGSHRVLSLCPFLSGGLDVPSIYISVYIYILVPNVLSSSNVLVISHHCNCLGTQWNLGEIK